jgi:hypothetical protein
LHTLGVIPGYFLAFVHLIEGILVKFTHQPKASAMVDEGLLSLRARLLLFMGHHDLPFTLIIITRRVKSIVLFLVWINTLLEDAFQ